MLWAIPAAGKLGYDIFTANTKEKAHNTPLSEQRKNIPPDVRNRYLTELLRTTEHEPKSLAQTVLGNALNGVVEPDPVGWNTAIESRRRNYDPYGIIPLEEGGKVAWHEGESDFSPTSIRYEQQKSPELTGPTIEREALINPYENSLANINMRRRRRERRK